MLFKRIVLIWIFFLYSVGSLAELAFWNDPLFSYWHSRFVPKNLEAQNQLIRYVVALKERTTDAEQAKFFCTGVFLSAEYVLTAAHCLDDKVADQLQVYPVLSLVANRSNSFRQSQPTEENPLANRGPKNFLSVKEIIRHPFYKRDVLISFDLAVLVLDHSFTGLPQKKMDVASMDEASPEQNIHVIGVHLKSQLSEISEIFSMPFRIVDKRQLGLPISLTQFAARGPQVTRPGHSGGPAFILRKDGHFSLLGVVAGSRVKTSIFNFAFPAARLILWEEM